MVTTHILKFRVTKTERQWIEQQARYSGHLRLAPYLRERAINKRTEEQRMMELLHQILERLK